MRVEDALDRVGFEGTARPDLATLERLQHAFLHAAPFENLDIHRGGRNRLELPAVRHKVVVQRRGGWCFELNEVFLRVVQGLGFDAWRASARVMLGGDGHPFDHQVTLLQLDRLYLADVGFGAFATRPLAVHSTGIQDGGDARYVVRPHRHEFVVARHEETHERSQYAFTLEPRTRPMFAERCAELQELASSHFTRKRMCTMLTAEGRVTLSGNRLTRPGHAPQAVDEGAYLGVLADTFGVRLAEGGWRRPTTR